jgi:hypothetical protein
MLAQHLTRKYRTKIEEISSNWLRVLCKFDAIFLKMGSNCALTELEVSNFDSFPSTFPIIPVYKARQFQVTLAETSKGMEEEAFSLCRNAGD